MSCDAIPKDHLVAPKPLVMPHRTSRPRCAGPLIPVAFLSPAEYLVANDEFQSSRRRSASTAERDDQEFAHLTERMNRTIVRDEGSCAPTSQNTPEPPIRLLALKPMDHALIAATNRRGLPEPGARL